MHDHLAEDERRETIKELLDLIVVVQSMGQRLANETHGDDYANVRQFNELVHLARVELARIADVAGAAR
jgi:hypothetical protein